MNTKTDKVLIKNKPEEQNAIVGIGASAGGLEAIESFFQVMPVDSGMAFVVIQHLSPDYKSMMVELLSRKTKIPVHRAEDGLEVKPDNIYLIPPKKNISIFHGKLILTNQKNREEILINLPVDIFLKSLAEDQGDRAVAVILSGTGSDGTRGVRLIKERGGLVLVQDEASAKFDGMPKAAVSTGVADFILPPGEMPSQLLAWLHHPYTVKQESTHKEIRQDSGLTKLFSLLRSKTQVDFTHYKMNTISRRIQRRITVTQSQNLDAYVDYAAKIPAEVKSLYRELLIGVTSFFRDSDVMGQLEHQFLPQMFKTMTDNELRFWIAGCSTGEEAYTIAILSCEVCEKLGVNADIKIFATDIDKEAIAKAGIGLFSESIAADLSPAVLTKYFYRRGDQYQIARRIREMIVFAQHNLVKDPPFTRIDFVSCRNLLIYLQPVLQQRALEMFNFSLKPGGMLLLGTSETTGTMDNFFEILDQKGKIYKALGKTNPVPVQIEHSKRNQNIQIPLPAGNIRIPGRAADRSEEKLALRLLNAISNWYIPLCVVVNEQLEVVYTTGDSRGLFTLPPGRAVYDITKMVDQKIAIPLATGIQKVFRTNEETIYTNVRVHEQNIERNLRLNIRSLPGRKTDEPFVSVIFEDINEMTTDDLPPNECNLDEETDQRLRDLEQELQFSRENLQATIEELETSNEELQATNEELLASNEELQSTNEELQSTNEELYTVNSEYQKKIMELTEAKNDIENLLSSSRIGTLILDEDLSIRHFSKSTKDLFNILESDIGRPLAHLSHKISDFDLITSVQKVQKSDETMEKRVKSENGKCYLVRIIPYRVGPDSYAGIVVTIVDISD
nr:chemotaxis protein CheB [uncultured Desulfobacter sp.]